MDAQFGTWAEVHWCVHNEKVLDKVVSDNAHVLEVMQYLVLLNCIRRWMKWTVYFSPKIQMLNSYPLVRWYLAFGRWFGLDEVMRDGIIRRGRETRSLSAMWALHVCQEEGSPQELNRLTPWSWTSQLLELWAINSCCLSQPVYGIMLWQPELTYTVSYRNENIIRTFEIPTPVLVPDLLRVLCIKKENLKLLKLLKLNLNNSEENNW